LVIVIVFAANRTWKYINKIANKGSNWLAKGYPEVSWKEICLVYGLKIDDAGKCNNRKVYVREVNMIKIERYKKSTSKSKVEAQAARALLGR